MPKPFPRHIFVLCGGHGTRLAGTLPDGLPKVMVPVCGKPLVEHLIDWFWNCDIGRITFCLHESQYEAVAHHLGSGWRWYNNLSLDYQVEAGDRLGTGGAFVQAWDLVDPDNTVWVCNGDTLFDVDAQRMVHWHRAWHTPVTLAACASSPGPSQTGLLVSAFPGQLQHLRAPNPNCTYTGLSLWDPVVLPLLRAFAREDPVFSVEDAITWLDTHDVSVGVFTDHSVNFHDCGTPDRLEHAPAFLEAHAL